ncbi:MAG: trypsin-like peptidase domain-containing protein [Rhodospirillales bacterium]|nr:trypsin-like peptidase domain-containing protein [Rhodospirillales bacterium]
MQFMVTLFGKPDNGVWAIQNLESIELQPADGDDRFFRVKDDLFLAQPNIIGTIRWVLGQSTVPMVAHIDGEPILRCLGTGFFVSCSGLLITAAHVVAEVLDKKYGAVKEVDDRTWYLGGMKLGVMVPINHVMTGFKEYIFREVEWACFLADRTESPLPFKDMDLKLTSDIAICKVKPISENVPFQPLTIVQKGLKGIGMQVGKSVSIVGYGAMQNVELSQIKENVISGSFPFELHVSRGEIVERFPDNGINKQALSPGPCFSTSAKLPAGMSGSPIYDDERIYVHGVVSTGWQDETGLAGLGYGSMLSHSMQIPISPLDNKSLLDLMSTTEHGISKISVPDA